MGKRNKSKTLPTIEKMAQIGFQDGYAGTKSKENELLNTYIKRKINPELTKNLILSYCLGYKKGAYILNKGISNIKTINGEIAIDGKPINVGKQKAMLIEKTIKESYKPKTQKKRR